MSMWGLGVPVGDWVSPLRSHLLEVVKGSQDDVVATSDQADSGQQLQHQSLGPAETPCEGVGAVGRAREGGGAMGMGQRTAGGRTAPTWRSCC